MLPPDQARPAQVVIPSPAEPPLGLVLTCGSPQCRHTFEPDPLAFAAARLSCPRCAGWTFEAELAEPSPAGGDRSRCGAVDAQGEGVIGSA